jgi:alpha-amylase
MVSVCQYFQVHQPYRIKNYRIFDIGKDHNYFNDNSISNRNNRQILNKVADKCYLPANKTMLNLIKQHPEFKIAYSISGTALEQFQEFNPNVLRSFQELVDTGNVELLGETYYHSLAALYSKKEFSNQVKLHDDKIKELFNRRPRVFRNTELIYNNQIAKMAEDMGYKGIIAEGTEKILDWRSPNFVYTPKNTKGIGLLLKNYKLSDDIAFRFSEKSWSEWPLTAEKYGQWVSAINGNGNILNLFMDYETFGEHQWEATGIFNFLSHLPQEILKHPDNDFKTHSEVIRDYKPVAELDVPFTISWADVERDISAWTGNRMQNAAINEIYKMQDLVLETNDDALITDWRKLTTSDHFYYMCTKWFADGDVHKYFNPHESPYDAYISFMNVLSDIKLRLREE